MKKGIFILLSIAMFALTGCSQQPTHVTFKVPIEDLAKIVCIDAKSEAMNVNDMYVCFNFVDEFYRNKNFVYIKMDSVVWLAQPRSHFFTVEGYRSDLQYKMAISLTSLKRYPLMVYPEAPEEEEEK